MMNRFTVFCLVTLVPNLFFGTSVHAMQEDANAKKLWAKFRSQLDSISTCEFEAKHYQSRQNLEQMTSFIVFRKVDDKLRYDVLQYIVAREGIVDERLTRRYFDGTKTTKLVITFPGLSRSYTPQERKGMRSRIDKGLVELNDVFFKGIGLTTFAHGGVGSFEDVYRDATKRSVDSKKPNTLILEFPDILEEGATYKERKIEFDFDPDKGNWPVEARFSSELSFGKNKSKLRGKRRIESFYELGNGLFFPKKNLSSVIDESGNEKKGVWTEVTSCKINEAIKESEVSFTLPDCIPVSIPADNDSERRLVEISDNKGNKKKFDNSDEFQLFLNTEIKGPDWTGNYDPISGLPYYFKDKEQVKKAIQKLPGKKASRDSGWIEEEMTSSQSPNFYTTILVVVLVVAGCAVAFGVVKMRAASSAPTSESTQGEENES